MSSEVMTGLLEKIWWEFDAIADEDRFILHAHGLAPRIYAAELKDAGLMLWLTQCKGTPTAKLIAYEMFYARSNVERT